MTEYPKPKKQVIVTLSTGKFIWWPALSIIDFIPKGSRSHPRFGDGNTIFLRVNSEHQALKAIVKFIDKKVKEQKDEATKTL